MKNASAFDLVFTARVASFRAKIQDDELERLAESFSNWLRDEGFEYDLIIGGVQVEEIRQKEKGERNE